MIKAAGFSTPLPDVDGNDRHDRGGVVHSTSQVPLSVERGTEGKLEKFAALCSALEIAERGNNSLTKIQAEQALRIFYARSSEEDQSEFRAFLEQQQEGESITDKLRQKLHERMASVAAVPFEAAAAFLVAVTPASIKISHGAAKLSAGVVMGAAHGVYKAGRMVFSKN